MKNFKDADVLSVYYKDTDAAYRLSSSLSPYIIRNPVFVCIGTDKCLGDCLGPLVGTLLLKNNPDLLVMGTLAEPVHAVNIEDTKNFISLTYPEHSIIAIDACIGLEESLGFIQLRKEPVHPGKGIGKHLPEVGSLSIVGIVDSIDNMDFFSIRTIRLGFIMEMAEIISKGISLSVESCKGIIK